MRETGTLFENRRHNVFQDQQNMNACKLEENVLCRGLCYFVGITHSLGVPGLLPSPYPIHTCATLSTAEGLVTHRCSRVSQLHYGLPNPPSLIEQAGYNINPTLPLSDKMLFQLAWWSTWPDDDSHSQMCNLPSGSLLVWTHCLYSLILKTARDKREIPVWLYKTVCYWQ